MDELIIHLYKYKEKIGLLEIYTNGAIIPSIKVLDSITNYKGNIQVTIGEYRKLSIAKETWIEFGEKMIQTINVLDLLREEIWDIMN